MRVFLTIIGAVAGLSLASGSHELFGIVLGAFAGFAAGEFGALRAKLKTVEDDLVALRKEMALRPRREAEPTETASPVRPIAPRPAPTAHPTSSQVSPPPTAGAWEPYGGASRPAAPAPNATAPAAPIANAPAAAPNSVPPAAGAAGARYNGQRPPEGAIDAAVRIVRDYFTGGNTLVRVGIIILFFGVAFLLRYAAEHSHIPIEFRLSGVGLGAIALLALGWLLRGKRPGYALALQGGACLPG